MKCVCDIFRFHFVFVSFSGKNATEGMTVFCKLLDGSSIDRKFADGAKFNTTIDKPIVNVFGTSQISTFCTAFFPKVGVGMFLFGTLQNTTSLYAFFVGLLERMVLCVFPNVVQDYHGNKTANKRNTCRSAIFYRYYTSLIFEIAVDHYLKTLWSDRIDQSTFTSDSEADELLAQFHVKLEYMYVFFCLCSL